MGTTDGFANIHAPNERVLIDEFEKAVVAEAEFFGRFAEALGSSEGSAARERRRPCRRRPTVTRFLERILDGIERFGNKMPNPAILFLALCVIVIVLSQVLYWFDVKATYQVVEPPPVVAEEIYLGGSDRAGRRRAERAEPASSYEIKTETTKVKGLLTGRRRPLPVHVVRLQLQELRAGRDHPGGDDRRRPRRGRRTDRGADTQARRRLVRRAA